MHLNNEHLADLFIKAKNGCNISSHRFVSILTPYLKRVLSIQLCPESEVDDIVQETFITMFKKGESFDPKIGSILAWSRTISIRRNIDVARKKNTRIKTVELFTHDKAAKEEDSVLQRMLSNLNSAMKDLTERELDFVDLHFNRGLSYEGCAKFTNRPAGTVKSSASRTLNKLRARFFELERAN